MAHRATCQPAQRTVTSDESHTFEFMEAANADTEATKTVMSQKLTIIEEGVNGSALGQFEAAKRWRTVNLLVKVPAALLPGVAGVTALASTTGQATAGIIVLVAARVGLTATLNAPRGTEVARSGSQRRVSSTTGSRVCHVLRVHRP